MRVFFWERTRALRLLNMLTAGELESCRAAEHRFAAGGALERPVSPRPRFPRDLTDYAVRERQWMTFVNVADEWLATETHYRATRLILATGGMETRPRRTAGIVGRPQGQVSEARARRSVHGRASSGTSRRGFPTMWHGVGRSQATRKRSGPARRLSAATPGRHGSRIWVPAVRPTRGSEPIAAMPLGRGARRFGKASGYS